MRKVTQFTKKGTLKGRANVLVDVYVEGSDIYHVAESVGLYRKISVDMKRFPFWIDVDRDLLYNQTVETKKDSMKELDLSEDPMGTFLDLLRTC